MVRIRYYIFITLLLTTTLLVPLTFNHRVRASPTLRMWIFDDESMYTNYKVIISANDTWEVGTYQVVTLTVEVISSDREGYLKLETIELGVTLHARTEVVSEILQVGDSYTHTMTFYVTEDDYRIYDNKAYEKSLKYSLGGRSYYRNYSGDADSASLYSYESWTITILGIEPVMSTIFSETTVNQGTPITIDVTIKYPSGRPIEGCDVKIRIDFKTYPSDYKGNGVYSIFINTDELSGEKEFSIDVRKSLYYDLVPKIGEEYKIIIVVESGESTRTCIIATATYGSELSPQVQFLRGFRDNTVLSTFAGSNFMTLFNGFYYSFSPSVASVIADNSALRDVMKVVLYPLIGILQASSTVFSVFSVLPELGIIAAGLIASSLIGIVYFLPLVLIFTYFKKFKVSEKIVRLLGLVLISSVLFLVLAEIFNYPPMMVTTGTFVLVTIATATLTSLRIVSKRLIH